MATAHDSQNWDSTDDEHHVVPQAKFIPSVHLTPSTNRILQNPIVTNAVVLVAAAVQVLCSPKDVEVEPPEIVYDPEQWYQYHEPCAVRIVRDAYSSYVQFFNIDPEEMRLLCQLLVQFKKKRGLKFRFITPTLLIFWGENYRLSLHFLSETDGLHFEGVLAHITDHLSSKRVLDKVRDLDKFVATFRGVHDWERKLTQENRHNEHRDPHDTPHHHVDRHPDKDPHHPNPHHDQEHQTPRRAPGFRMFVRRLDFPSEHDKMHQRSEEADTSKKSPHKESPQLHHPDRHVEHLSDVDQLQHHHIEHHPNPHNRVEHHSDPHHRVEHLPVEHYQHQNDTRIHQTPLRQPSFRMFVRRLDFSSSDEHEKHKNHHRPGEADTSKKSLHKESSHHHHKVDLKTRDSREKSSVPSLDSSAERHQKKCEIRDEAISGKHTKKKKKNKFKNILHDIKEIVVRVPHPHYQEKPTARKVVPHPVEHPEHKKGFFKNFGKKMKEKKGDKNERADSEVPEEVKPVKGHGRFKHKKKAKTPHGIGELIKKLHGGHDATLEHDSKHHHKEAARSHARKHGDEAKHAHRHHGAKHHDEARHAPHHHGAKHHDEAKHAPYHHHRDGDEARHAHHDHGPHHHGAKNHGEHAPHHHGHHHGHHRGYKDDKHVSHHHGEKHHGEAKHVSYHHEEKHYDGEKYR